METLAAKDYASLYPLLKDIENRAVFIYSVLERKQQGNVFVDNKDNITAALITSCGGFYCLLGTPNNQKFNKDVIDFLTKKDNHKINFYALALFSKEWTDFLRKHELPNANKIMRSYFSFNKEKFIERYSKETFIPSKPLNLVELNPSIAKKYIEDFYSYYSIVWETVSNFVENGVAQFITHEDQIVSVCSSPYVGGGYAEIDIITIDDYKRKGLATSAGIHFIQTCINKGLTPNWCCHADNIESLKTANKLCFEKIDEQPMYWYNA